MNKNLSALSPAAVWRHFEAICQIPHPSYFEEKIREYIISFAKEHSLEWKEDEAHNIYIAKPATEGMEDRAGIVMQAHLDMVPQKNNDTQFDFEKDPIEAYIDGDWVTANGTTLGADNGIGVAAMLAVLEDTNLVHGNIEALFTATEEAGMEGAFGLKAGLLKSDIMLNLDSEDEGELYVGCAGGEDVNVAFNYTPQSVAPSGNIAVKLSVKGLKGGHSGIQIVEQRANANKLAFRLLNSTSISYLIGSINGGSLRNAIPREAELTLVISDSDFAALEQQVKRYEAVVQKEFADIEDAISITLEKTDMPTSTIDKATAERIVRSVVVCPDGVIKMSTAMKGLVQTSTNLAIVVSDEKSVKLQCLMRSSSNSEKAALGSAMEALFKLSGAEIELSGAYNGWNPNMASPILKTMRESYTALYGIEPKVMAIHAGLECGIISGPYPELDMISFGPTIRYPHSPDEKVEIASVAKFYDFLVHTLANAPKKG